jgi:hypothetical protein
VNAADLTKVVVTLTERLENTNKLLESNNKALDELRAEQRKLQEAYHAHQLKTTEETTRLKAEVEELKKNKDLWGNRAFTIFMCLASGVLGVILTSLFKKP